MTTYVHRPKHDRWCTVRSAHPGGLVIFACGDGIDYAPVCISTARPADRGCAECDAELARRSSTYDHGEAVRLVAEALGLVPR